MGSTGKSRGSSVGVTTVDLGNRGTITVDVPLRYSADSGSPAIPQSVKDFENKRRTAKIEYGMAVKADGTVVEENKGTKNHVSMTVSSAQNSDIFTHVHPRTGVENTQIGGTFSDADIRNWARFNQTTYRAVASEGTYSITKGAGMRSDPQVARDFVREFEAQTRAMHRNLETQIRPLGQQYRDTARALGTQYLRGEISREQYTQRNNEAYNNYIESANRAINSAYIGQHNWLLDNQARYGYTYGLER